MILNDSPSVMALYLPGGGMKGITQLAVLARLEELTGKSPAELFQIIEGASVGGFLAAGMNVRDPNDPYKPRYTMLEGLSLFTRLTPEVFPFIKHREGKMLLDGAFKYVENDSYVGKGFLALASHLNPMFGRAADHAKRWSQDHMFDQQNLEKIFKEVLGDTKLSESIGTLYVPAYNPVTEKVELFLVKKDDLMASISERSNTEVSHSDPYLWEVAMAATANNFAFEGYKMKGSGQVYLDGALLHKAVSPHLFSKENPGIPVELVEIHTKSIGPLSAYLPGDTPLMNVYPYEMDEATFSEPEVLSAYLPGDRPVMNVDPDTLKADFDMGGPMRGFLNGKLPHVFRYIEHVKAYISGSMLDDTKTTRIAPFALGAGEDPADLPNYDILDASPPMMILQLNYAIRTVLDQELSISDLAQKTMHNLLLRGEITEQEYDDFNTELVNKSVHDSLTVKHLKGLIAEQEEKMKPDNEHNEENQLVASQVKVTS